MLELKCPIPADTVGMPRKISEPAVRTGTGHHGKKRRICPVSLFSSSAKN